MDEKHASPWPTPSPDYLANTVPNETPRMFRLIDEPFDPPAEVQQRSREFIARVAWTFSTTMRKFPHEYVVRARTARELRAAYDQLWRDTHEHGYRGRFGRILHHYMTVDGWRYWSCSITDCGPERQDGRPPCPHSRFEVGCVINRALNDDLPPRQLSLEMSDER